MRIRAALISCAYVCLWPAAAVALQSGPPAETDGIRRLVSAIETAVQAGDDAALRALATPGIERAALSQFVQSMTLPKASSATIKERDRTPIAGGRERLMLEALTVSGAEGRVSSWRLDAEPGTAAGSWRIADVDRLSVVSGLFQLSLDASTEWEARNLVIHAPDLTLTVRSGYAFAARTPQGSTAMVLVGRGRMDFSPGPEAEQEQLHVFCGADALRTDFNAVFIRVSPEEFALHVDEQALKPREVDSGHVRKASELFDAYVSRSFLLDLNDLSAVRWSLIPSAGDFVAEIATRKYDTLTYARASAEPEDISVFDRRRRRNLSVYTSEAKLAARGRFFSEDDRSAYDILHYDLATAFAPERLWIDGSARLKIRTGSESLSTITMRLADPLVVRSISSPQYGQLLHLRIVGQNSVLVGFPGTVAPGTEVDLAVTYGGRLIPQGTDREALTLAHAQEPVLPQQEIVIPPEPQWAYSNRSYWYPQAPVTDYATATMTLTVPAEYSVVASGTAEGPPETLPAAAGERERRKFVFEAKEPARYLACIVSRFDAAPPVTVTLRDESEPITLTVDANPRQSGRSKQFADKATDILKFYGSLMEDAPYDSFTLAILESDLPGGHSPPYFAMLNQPLPTSPFAWTNDPVSFPTYPSFFIAHEIAHQWWGQGVGWKNYHEQWISEGFAQYFAALYAGEERGPDQFTSVIQKMRRWAIEMSPQGPVYLGYRLGHIKNDGRVFRALVYNKGALVLHMLRRLIGDDAFFSGLRDFYTTWRYKKAGTDDFRVAMEQAAGGRSLTRFFDRWIFASGIPTIQAQSTIDGSELHLRFDQGDEVYDVPLTVTISYRDGTSEDVVVPLTEKSTVKTVALRGTVRDVEYNKDGAALAEVRK